MYKKTTFALLMLVCSVSISADNTTFKDKQRVVFIGDSITHGGTYHKNIALFHATRFPHKKIDYINAGISGDTAKGTLLRFDRDIAVHQPDVATIMLGMNDVGRYLYETPLMDKEALQQRHKRQKEIRESYLSDMRALVQKLLSLKSEVILITPSIFDQTANMESAKYLGLKDALQMFATGLHQIAKEFNVEIVDFQSPMLSVNSMLQANNSASSVVGKDRVHPGEQGHFVMSYAYLKSMKNVPDVTDININLDRPTDSSFQQCPLEGELLVKVNKITFTCQAKALPFPVEGQQKEALNWISFTHEFNQLKFQLSGLDKGIYKIEIDGKNIGAFTDTHLIDGINLANIRHTPMYQQALKVKAINDKRAQVSAKLRDIAQVRYSMLDKYPDIDRNNAQLVSDTLYGHVEQSKGQPWYNYLKKQVAIYLAEADKVALYRQQINDLHIQMYQSNQPQSHQWTITKIGL